MKLVVWLESHLAIQTATIEVTDRIHPSTMHLPEYWERTDEWYNYNKNPRGQVHVLATLDESSYSGGNMGEDSTAWMNLMGASMVYWGWDIPKNLIQNPIS